MKKTLLTTSVAAAFLMLTATNTVLAEDVNFAGTYLIESAKVINYEDGNPVSEITGSFNLVINSDLQVTEFANIQLEYPVKGNIDGNAFTIQPSIFDEICLEESAEYDLELGNSNLTKYNPLNITLSYVDGKYVLVDFTLWQFMWDSYSYVLDQLWSEITVTKTAEGEINPPSDDPADDSSSYLGSYTVSGTYTPYVNGVAGESANLEFEMNILLDAYDMLAMDKFAGYDLPEVYDDPGISLWEEEPGVLTITTDGWCYITEPDLDNNHCEEILGSVGPEYDATTIEIVFDGESGTISAFGIWGDIEYDDWGQVLGASLIGTWENMTFTKSGTSAIKGLEIENSNTPAVFYNLQGVQVANPSNGIFIKKQGNKTTKVLIRK